MFERDYVMRMVQQLAQAIARILKLAESQQFDEALADLDVLARGLLGLTPDALSMLAPKDIAVMFTTQGKLDADRLAMAARLMAEQAELHEGRGTHVTAARRRLSALELFTLAAETDRKAVAQHDEAVEKLVSVIDPTLPEVRAALFRLHAARGAFARAEDALYAWLETEPSARDSGRAFYERLLDLDDDALNAGNLPRDEVQEGRSRLG